MVVPSAGAQPPFESYPAIAIEGLTPEIDGGRWPVKRVVGANNYIPPHNIKKRHDLMTPRLQ